MGLPIDVFKYVFEAVTVCDKPMIFTNTRVNRNTVPKGLYVYDVRHSDNDDMMPIELAHFILVNHLGTVISAEPIELNERGRRELRVDEEHDEWFDWNYEGYDISLIEYIKQFKPEIL